MLMTTLYAKQKKRHRCIEQIFGLCGRRRGGIRMGNTCKSMADSLQCMTKLTTKKKKNPETGGECYMVCKCLLENSRSQIKLNTFNKKLKKEKVLMTPL